MFGQVSARISPDRMAVSKANRNASPVRWVAVSARSLSHTPKASASAWTVSTSILRALPFGHFGQRTSVIGLTRILPVPAGPLEHRPHEVHFPGDRGRLDLREPGVAP